MILLPASGDNAGIATRRLEKGATFDVNGSAITVRQTVLEGHRVATTPIDAGQLILSWSLPFGRALKPIAPGEYLCNARILDVLRQRHVDFEIPAEPNFENYRLRCVLDEKSFVPGAQTALYREPRYFSGYPRANGRGAGTRNFLVVLATSSRANSVARAVAEEFKSASVVAVNHTEGAGPTRPNNFDLVVRSLNGFLRNPNVAAFVAIDEPHDPVNNRCLTVTDPPGAFVSITGTFDDAVARAKAEVARLLPVVAACPRAQVSVERLKIGLQCGGSDAFSGVSGNPLVGWIARETVRCGGAANLAETAELIGAESYVLANVRDLATARAFLETVARFERWAGWHGHSAEGNPSGGNLFRGLYNITVKSIGAALKKSADTRVDYVIDYGDPMDCAGFYFMDSPGNDLESIAGQVASGCNLILFTTGNGSITNFPFVPTIKVMTTTGRYEMLRREMDFNAGRYLDGEPMEKLGAEAFDLTLRVASGELSAGEKAGHAQTQLWRNWRQTGPGADLRTPTFSGQPLKIRALVHPISAEWKDTKFISSPPRFNLVIPTSLCSGQIGLMIADAANRQIAGQRCVALPHTEGCGNSVGESERLMLRTLAAYAVHPLARRVLMLEHGCEKTHNDAFRNVLAPEQAAGLGWLSVQLDGGIEPVIRKAVKWFSEAPRENKTPAPVSLSHLRIAFLGESNFFDVPQILADLGALVVIPGNSEATIDYGQPAPSHGLHVMRAPTEDLTEILSGLGATGVELIVLWNDGPPAQRHPFIPVLEINSRSFPQKAEAARDLLSLILRAASGETTAALPRHADFQITRGLEGVSL
jgi:altronate dehydratase